MHGGARAEAGTLSVGSERSQKLMSSLSIRRATIVPAAILLFRADGTASEGRYSAAQSKDYAILTLTCFLM